MGTADLDRERGCALGLGAHSGVRPAAVHVQREVSGAVPELELHPLRIQAELAANSVERRAEGVERFALPSPLPHVWDTSLVSCVVDATRDILAIQPLASRSRKDRRGAWPRSEERRVGKGG